jgi:hypothetical protein
LELRRIGLLGVASCEEFDGEGKEIFEERNGTPWGVAKVTIKFRRFRSIEISTFLLLAELGIEERYRSATFWYWYMNEFWPLFLLLISNFILGY